MVRAGSPRPGHTAEEEQGLLAASSRFTSPIATSLFLMHRFRVVGRLNTPDSQESHKAQSCVSRAGPRASCCDSGPHGDPTEPGFALRAAGHSQPRVYQTLPFSCRKLGVWCVL